MNPRRSCGPVEVPKPVLRTLNRQEIQRYMPMFISIAADIEGEYWAAENFLRDLPEKWELSFAAWWNDKPIGYAILSRKSTEQAHLHHFMLASEFRNLGLGTIFVQEIEHRVKCSGAGRLTLKTDAKNAQARRFYSRMGCSEIGREGDYLLLEKWL